jgi:hypothetical protein
MSRDRSTPWLAVPGAILMTACATPPAASAPQGNVLAVDQVAGYWSLRGPGGGRCDLSLSSLLIDGVRPVLAERCGLPGAAAARTWRATAGGFELLGADGAVLMAFRRIGEDEFVAVGGGFILRRAPLA